MLFIFANSTKAAAHMLLHNDLEDLESLRKYHYQSEDHSILAKLVLKRYWNFVVKQVPMNVAPNTITVLGGVSMLLSAGITLTLDPTLNNAKTRFLHLLNAILLFFYSTMDSIDGRQAVRTQSTSALGQLMDHGTDSLVCTLVAITCASTLGLGRGTDLVLLMFFLYIPFYYLTLYERFTSKMVFGYINGPSEGIMFCVVLHLLALFFGPQLFSFFTNRNLSQVFRLKITNGAFLMLVSYVVYNIYFFADFAVRIGPKHLPMAIKKGFMIYGLFLPSILIASTQAGKGKICTYTNICITMLLFSYLTIDLILSRIMSTAIPAPPVLYFLFMLLSLLCLVEPYSKLLNILLPTLLAFTSVWYVSRVVYICERMSKFLGISVFKVGKIKV